MALMAFRMCEKVKGNDMGNEVGVRFRWILGFKIAIMNTEEFLYIKTYFLEIIRVCMILSVSIFNASLVLF